MKYFAFVVCLLGMVSVARAEEVGMVEVRELGRLNGQALACSQSENIARIKAVMIENAPKSRQYGAAFEQATHESFLVRSREQETCGDAPVLALKVEDLVGRLRKLFPAQAVK